MVDYDLGKVVGDKGEQGDDGNGIVSITKTSTSGLVDTYTILFTNGTTTTFEVTNGSSGIADIVTSWSATLHDDKVPSEKLAKNSLDAKLDNAISSTAVTIASNDNILITDYSDSNKVKRVSSILASQMKDSNAHSNIGSSANASQSTINTNIDTALSGKANSSSLSTVATTGSYNDLTNKPTIPSISGLEETANKVTSWSTTTTDAHYPSEKLVKTSLDAKANSSSLSTVATSGSYNDLSNKPSIPSSSSDLSDGSNIVKKSSTNGLLKNDGSVDTNAYITSSALPTIQTSWGSTTSDSKVASEKLIKSSLDGKLDNTIGSSAVTIASDDNILITDTSDNSKVKKVANILASQVKDGSAHSNIGSSANATQSSINSSIDTALSGKQATLVSGTNIKTINSESILGSGNLTIQTLDDTKLFKYYYAPNDFITPNRWYTDYDHCYPTFENGNLIFTTDCEYRFVFSEYPYKVRENFSIRFKYKASVSNQYTTLKINGTTIVQNTTTENDVEITTTNGNAIVTNHTTNQTYDLQGNLERIDLLVRSGTASIYEYTYSANDSFEKQVPTEKVIQGTALSNIGTSKGATQSEINSAIDYAISQGGGGSGGSCVTDFYIDTNTDEWVIETSACSQGEVVTSWSSTLTDTKVPSEKLVKQYVDGLVGSAITYIVGSG